MNNKSIKTHFDISVFITFLLLFLFGLALFSFKWNSHVDCSDVDFDIISNSYTVEDLIEFKSTDISGASWIWDFGDDAPKEYRADVAHQFKKPGKYTVSLQMNGQCMATRDIVIAKIKIIKAPELIPNIILPQQVRVGEKVEFFNDSKFAKSWQWSFGETTTVDGTNQKESYTYETPGKKTVLLIVNGDRRHEAKRILTVLPPKTEVIRAHNRVVGTPIKDVIGTEIRDAPLVEEPSVPNVNEDKPAYVDVSSADIKDMLLKYSRRNLDDTAIRKYFKVSDIPVFNKKGDRFTVSEFFNTIRDVNKLDISSIKLYRDEKTGKITSMTIDMRYKSGVFWSNF